MDRRKFLAASGLAAATPVLAYDLQNSQSADPAVDWLKKINFTSDGLGLEPSEYINLLHQTTNPELKADYYSNGGVIEELEQKFAKLLGKQAAMFVPTGTLANHLALRKLAGNDRRVLVQAESHIYNDSGDCAEVLSGLNLVPLATGRSTIPLAEIKDWVERSAHGRVPTKVGVISIESPVRRKDHELHDFDELQHISTYAREQGIRLHMDGARMFNLPFHSGKSIKEYAALFDTVYLSLWKHFNGATGAMLVGTTEFIEGLYHTRRMFGGSLPHAWPQVALVAQYVDSFEADYANAWHAADQLITLLQSSGRFKVRKLANGTSRFFLKVPDVAPEVFAERASKQAIIFPKANPETGEFALQVNPTILRIEPAKLARLLIDSSKKL